jgi:CRP/FNR family transcriptional regulator, anaerobic regulatory protein
MVDENLISRWMAAFPKLPELEPEHRVEMLETSEYGREILFYQVGPGETCVLTTSCLMAGRGFPAESSAETDVLLAVLPAPVFHRLLTASAPFRQFVLNNCGDLLSSLITLVDEVAFASLDLRLARRLLAEADDLGSVAKTHQQLALDLGSVREVITRYLREWERAGWVRASRGSIEVAILARWRAMAPPAMLSANRRGKLEP